MNTLPGTAAESAGKRPRPLLHAMKCQLAFLVIISVNALQLAPQDMYITRRYCTIL